MSARLKTELEWENAGYAIIYGEKSEHRNKHGEALFRPDQVETPWYDDIDEELMTIGETQDVGW